MLIFSCTLSWGQEIVNDNISDLIKAEISNLPAQGTDVYQAPTGTDKVAWSSVVSKVIAREYSLAAQEATAIGYELINVKNQFEGHEMDLYLLKRLNTSTNYWGTYVFNERPLRPWVAIQSPHAIKDRNTGVEGIHVFRSLGARAFFLTGTDRCNSKTKTNCSGSTSVCSSGSEAYPISDVAHNTSSGFQVVTELLNDSESPYFIQFHGFTKKSTDPYMISSLGARSVVGPNKMHDIEQSLLDEDGSLTFKNSSNSSWSRLLAFTNTQGRYINQGSDPCTENAEMANGRFIHIEQEYNKLRASFTQWDMMARALKNVFPEFKEGVLTVKFEDEVELFPSPLKNTLKVMNPLEVELQLSLLSINGTILKRLNIPAGETSHDVSKLKKGVYIYTLSSNDEIIKRGSTLKVN